MQGRRESGRTTGGHAPGWAAPGARPATPETPLGVAAHRGWMAGGLAAARVCIFVLGLGVRLSAR